MIVVSERFQHLLDLWKIDDPLWVEQRKVEWTQIRSRFDLDAKRDKIFAQFYVYGEREPAGHDGSRFSFFVISPLSRFMLTPYTSPVEARRLYSAMNATESEEVLTSYLRNVCSDFIGTNSLWQKIVDYLSGVWWSDLQEGSHCPEVFRRATPFFVDCYIADAIAQMKYGKERIEKRPFVHHAAGLVGELLKRMFEEGADEPTKLDNLILLLHENSSLSDEDERKVIADELIAKFKSAGMPPWVAGKL